MINPRVNDQVQVQAVGLPLMALVISQGNDTFLFLPWKVGPVSLSYPWGDLDRINPNFKPFQKINHF
jgi:hypothetical protein